MAEITRRAAFGMAALPLVPQALGAAEPDPLLVLVDAYRESLAHFNRVYREHELDPDFLFGGGSDALAEATCRPYMREIEQRAPTPTTREGTIAALRCAHDDILIDDDGEAGFVGALIAASLRFLEGERGHG